MLETGTEYQLKLVRWQFFCTFTWRAGKLGSVSSRESDLWNFLRDWSADYSVKLSHLLVALRWEKGEIGDRPHAHALLAGLPRKGVSVIECYRRANAWNISHGLARIRVITNWGGDPMAYLTKGRDREGRGLRYEISKYDAADRMVINEAAWGAMCRASGVPHVPQLATS